MCPLNISSPMNLHTAEQCLTLISTFGEYKKKLKLKLKIYIFYLSESALSLWSPPKQPLHLTQLLAQSSCSVNVSWINEWWNEHSFRDIVWVSVGQTYGDANGKWAKKWQYMKTMPDARNCCWWYFSSSWARSSVCPWSWVWGTEKKCGRDEMNW